MFDYFVGNSLWHLIRQADFVSKGVLFLLFIMSVICWTIFICKFILLRLRMRDIRRVQDRMQAIRTLDDLINVGIQYSHTASGQFISQAALLLRTLRELQPTQTMQNWQIMQYHLDQMVDTFIANEESYLPVLSTSAAVSPLLGLFGTVWGLVHAFISISEKQTADITVVAPGIAEALMTTLAGLIVAVPALVMYNYLVVRLRHIEHQFVHLTDKVTVIMQQTLQG